MGTSMLKAVDIKDANATDIEGKTIEGSFLGEMEVDGNVNGQDERTSSTVTPINLDSLESALQEAALEKDAVPARKKRPRHLAFKFSDDPVAHTAAEDPVQMKQLYFLPLVVAEGPEGSKADLVFSKEYIFATRESDKANAILPKLEKWKGEHKNLPAEGIRWGKRKYSVTQFVDDSVINRLKEDAKAKAEAKANRKIAKRKLRQKQKNSSRPVPAETVETQMLVTVTEGTIAYSIHFSSINCLKPKGYLNDEIINYFLVQCLQSFRHHQADVDISDIAFFPTHMWLSSIFKPLDEKVAERKVAMMYKLLTNYGQHDLLQKKYLIIPVAREQHWFLVIICHPFPDAQVVQTILGSTPLHQCSRSQAEEIYKQWYSAVEPPTVLVFDSMLTKMHGRCGNYSQFQLDTMQYIRQALTNVHKMYWGKKQARELESIASASGVQHFVMNVPGQPNNADCGIFCIAYIKAWFCLKKYHRVGQRTAMEIDFNNLFSSADLNDERQKMLHYIRANCSPELQLYIPLDPSLSFFKELKEESDEDEKSVNTHNSSMETSQPPASLVYAEPFDHIRLMIMNKLGNGSNYF